MGWQSGGEGLVFEIDVRLFLKISSDRSLIYKSRPVGRLFCLLVSERNR